MTEDTVKKVAEAIREHIRADLYQSFTDDAFYIAVTGFENAARASISAMSEWRPIKEAPKDQEILVTGFIYNDPKRGRWIELVEWNGSGWACEYATVHPPTHWMRLPLPPEGER